MDAAAATGVCGQRNKPVRAAASTTSTGSHATRDRRGANAEGTHAATGPFSQASNSRRLFCRLRHPERPGCLASGWLDHHNQFDESDNNNYFTKNIIL